MGVVEYPVVISQTLNPCTGDGFLVECLVHQWFHVHSWNGAAFAEQEAARHRATYHKECGL